MFWWWIIWTIVAVSAKEFDTNLPFPGLCNMYYALDSCPPEELFSALTSLCEPSEKVACKNVKAEELGAPSAALQLVAFPHPKSCDKYYRLASCPGGFNFNPDSNQCDLPASKGCPPGCANILPAPGFIVRPESCLAGYSKYLASCTVTCQKPYQQIGDHTMTCTEAGWNSTQGLNRLPTCTTPVNLIINVIRTLTEELQGTDANILFVTDESGSVTARNFQKQKSFMTGVISSFPLSQNRSAGVVLFSDKARVVVSLKTSDTCSFIKQVNEMSYEGGGTDIRLALNQALDEVQKNADHTKKLVVLLTDGQSKDATDAANALKDIGATILTFGVTGFDEDQLKSIASLDKIGEGKLFFAVSESKAFDAIADYLQTTYIKQMEQLCI